jgi:EmrB/QacA subfamily drug resistance transporter
MSGYGGPMPDRSDAMVKRVTLVACILGSGIALLDGTVVNVALPTIQRALGGGLAAQQWVSNGYLLTLGSLILVGGSLGDLYGERKVFALGVAGFGAASALCAVAPSIGVLVAARALQGIAGALLVPSSLALITSNFRGAAQGKAIGVWTGMTSVAMIAGPLLGGLSVDFLSWRFAFLINVLPIAVTLWLLVVLGHKDTRRAGISIDYFGAVLCTLGLGGPVYALIEAPHLGWSHPAIFLSMGLGILAFAGFLVRQRFAKDPIMPLSLFRVRNFWTGNVATAFIYGALALTSFALGIYLQQGAGLPATLAGLASLPITIIMILFSSRVGGLSGRFGPRIFMTIGPIIMGLSTLLLLLVSKDFNYWWQVLPALVLFGIGLTITVSPLTSAILGSIDTERSGIASAVNNAVARVAGLIVIAMIAIIIGGQLDLDGFHRAAIVTAAMLIAGGLVSFAGIRNPVAADEKAVTAPADSATTGSASA